MEFIQCTLADGHFCALNTSLYHVDTSQWCVMMTKLTFIADLPFPISLTPGQLPWPGLWAISVEEPVPMEVKCQDHSHIKTLEPPFTLINMQPVCSAFSSAIKLPPYFKQYSSGFHITLKSANLQIPKYTPFSFRVWKHFDLSNITKPEVYKFKKTCNQPQTSQFNQLRAQIANLWCITSHTDRPWIYYVGGGSGSGLVLPIMICCFLYWCCKRTQNSVIRSPACVTIA